ncbi:beta-1,4-N-acetylgalactosaminyltransferase bre-4-like [Mytilus californianus]|uniref:beta-1,4-N-acetylgalactosaminyltransferase bre-4-like n=1 Tax=Mytilus californianus TaxID=6549 RepID=UPI0022483734|nr:beta-1,4-N-acetylgalactosaminyltransferase bre-4-like [Mytilus californianus]XP_052089996.1 beta-1,4-N-acetylgalactosaminyltransferase bre-4-like [Mytilus californianus]XP_052089998.1 beta-1,4-N-acetylgalactosaminyltransferase bre-4-like [Mytilus californianus]
MTENLEKKLQKSNNIYESNLNGMGDANERYCAKGSVFKSLFLVLLFLITIQIAFNLSIQQAAFTFMSKWVQVSEQLYSSSSRLAQLHSSTLGIPKGTPSAVSFQKEQSTQSVIKSDNNVTYVCSKNVMNVTSEDCLPLCPVTSDKLVGALATYSDSPTYSDLDRLYPWVQDGGRGKPSYCYPRHRVAIIIPYRNRDSQLRTFLYNIHPILYRQELDYGIYVVEQNGSSKFNRAMLMNIGYAEAMKIHDYQCFVFHDVDLIPENDKNIYNCPKQPRHMSVAIDKFKYRLPYTAIFGGVSSLTKEQFQKVNGFPNRYFGWGGEDDDMWNRIHNAGYKVIRYAMEIARYKMIKHGTETGNKANPGRFKMLKESKKYFKTDGINSLKYKVLKIDFNHLYTRVVVDIDEKEVMAGLKRS